MTEKIGVLGGGSWGTSLAILLAQKGYDVDIWSRDKEQIKEMKESRINKKYLPDAILPSNLNLTNDLEEANSNKDLIILSVGTHGVREVLENSKPYIKPNQIIVNVSKGIENETLVRISQIVEELIPDSKYAVLSGPSHAEEVANNIPTTVVSASKDKEIAEYVQDLFITPSFRVYTNPDVIGVELGGALKNVIALGAGISDGLDCGDNTKAALMTRGIFEMARLGEKMGAQINTFSGLSGIGDLIVTCTSMHSRNRRAGILIGQGMKIDHAIKKIGMVVEGIRTTKSTFELAKKYNINMPITEEIYGVLYENKDVKNSVLNLMVRDRKHEMENIVLENNNLW
ncbi:NAD(P)H-dependent glycerol-3-phosphate dehydrogenase [Tissierella praeacuta]|uniref:NAD(P)H-dependent glycerol-3-phosphate dehydrogenase n=1 Tax=Tissierella praeacuta TaxID=43131 RepID=UPI00333E556F